MVSMYIMCIDNGQYNKYFVFAENSDLSYETRKMINQTRRIDAMIKKEQYEMGWLSPLKMCKRACLPTKANAERILSQSRIESELKHARKFLIKNQRKEWLELVRREIALWGWYDKRAKKLYKSREDEEVESAPAQKKRKIEVEETKLSHKVLCQVLGYNDNREEEDQSKI